jgi:hypothetical protein
VIRPEAAAFLTRWAETGIAAAVTLAALWIVGLPDFSLNWLSVLLGAPLAIAGLVWMRVAIRRARAQEGEGQGKLFVEERRVLHVGAFGNVQVDLDDATRIDLFARGQAATLTVQVSEGPPTALPLGAEGVDALFDALTGLPGMDMDRLHGRLAKARRAGGAGEMVTVWTRPVPKGQRLGR